MQEGSPNNDSSLIKNPEIERLETRKEVYQVALELQESDATFSFPGVDSDFYQSTLANEAEYPSPFVTPNRRTN